jgi:hypothetical protein
VSKLRVSVPSKAVLQFWWRTSSEVGHDVAQCRLNGAVALDAVANQPLSLSGETGWVKQRIQNEGTGPTAIEFSYSKDTSLSEGLDRVWISNITVSTEPIINRNPQPQWLPVGHSVVGLNVGAEGAIAFQWKKDSIPLSDVSSAVRQIWGSNSSSLNIVGATSGDSGNYTVDVIGGDMTVSSRPVSVSVAGPPVITQKLSGTQSLQQGDTLFLNLGVSGVKPLFVLWQKNGLPLRWTQTTTLVIPNVSSVDEGSYSAVVVNPYGHVASEGVFLGVTTGSAK